MKLNLNYYSGKDQYSDGLIENDLLKIVKNETDFDKVLSQDNRWPILYHLSSIRNNIINWYPFSKNETLLEIGGGCGALTGLFCQKLQSVKVIELSKLRSQINLERNRQYQNFEILVGNLNDMEITEKFDYITLIGVLEYAGNFTKGKDPYLEFLKNIKHYLKPTGKLIIAIENKFGLKYFAGAKEDHTGIEFDGITGYKHTSKVKTFGKVELENLLTSSGYSKQDFFYPHPDYKLPLEIYSSNYLPSEHSNLAVSPNFDSSRYHLFDETSAYKEIIKNSQYEFFANSFLVICEE
ncbi:MAG: class I SAM-dependent methyltransferase [Candidatus Muirbacterium halophilum]|nr:class I SAM-dependent methyltransferase [Candidatus Muirbacterium halophilum]MCK9477306.1 class I SAM-dependent methyltransferase [Candidatus Muirbacterium halophilum]